MMEQADISSMSVKILDSSGSKNSSPVVSSIPKRSISLNQINQKKQGFTNVFEGSDDKINGRTDNSKIKGSLNKKIKKSSRESSSDFEDLDNSVRDKKTVINISFKKFVSSPPVYNKLFQPKRVLTPDWVKISGNNKQDESQGKEEKNVNIESEKEDSFERAWMNMTTAERHQRVELFESRINWGLMPSYEHPAQAVYPAYEGVPFVMTKEEYEKSLRYNCESVKHIIPGVWEGRIWDKPEHKLSPEDNAELDARISESMVIVLPKNHIHPYQKPRKAFKRSQSASINPVKRGRPRKLPLECCMIKLSLQNFETDDDDELSDLSLL